MKTLEEFYFSTFLLYMYAFISQEIALWLCTCMFAIYVHKGPGNSYPRAVTGAKWDGPDTLFHGRKLWDQDDFYYFNPYTSLLHSE